MRPVRLARWLAPAVLATGLVLAVSCGGAPVPADQPVRSQPKPIARRAVGVVDDCAELPGKPPPKPLRRKYTGVAAKARCDREVYTIMGGLTHFLGVKCLYCHVRGDWTQPTDRTEIANWMARELIPSLQKKGGGEIWCDDCHVVGGKGTAKILGHPRDDRWAVEWMTTRLAERFDIAGGELLRCKSCHQGNPGSSEFQKKIILTDHLPRRRGAVAPTKEAPMADGGTDAAHDADPAD